MGSARWEMDGCREDRRAVECSVCKVKVKVVEGTFPIFNKPESCGLEAGRPRGRGNGAGVVQELRPGPEWQVGMVCEVLGLPSPRQAWR